MIYLEIARRREVEGGLPDWSVKVPRQWKDHHLL